MKIYYGIGLMSGTSLDGLDFCYVEFPYPNLKQFRIIQSETLNYEIGWKEKLKNAHQLSGEELTRLDVKFGQFLGKSINNFIEKYAIRKVDFIASHGQTIFHQPENGYTLQIGNGQAIQAQTNLHVVYDFRSSDVFLGGQGAPLVPIGDQLLFSNYASCLNLGGISNISFEKNKKRIAFDISPFNLVLNFLAEKKGKAYDENGELAHSGIVNAPLLEILNHLDYYNLPYPKSLGIEFCYTHIFPLIRSSTETIENLLATFVEHFSYQIAKVLNENQIKNVLVTGGGAYNSYFISELQKKTNSKIIIPEKQIIEYKEALIFALMGLLKIENQINVYSSVTGAKKNHSAGILLK